MVFGNCSFQKPFTAFKTARIIATNIGYEQRVQSYGELKGAMSVSDIIQLDSADVLKLQILHGTQETQFAEGSLKIAKII